MKARMKKGIAAAAVAASVVAALTGAAGSSSAQTSGPLAFGISTDGTLMATFDTAKPGVLNWFRQVTGLVCGEKSLIGIDIRVQDKTLYGVGDKGCIYTIKIVSDEVVITKVSQLTVPLYGTNFGIDFNPAADRLRVISDWGQNLRHDLNTHTTTEDVVLTTPPNATTRGVTAAAYTNNDLDPSTATTLFDIGTNTDQVLIQSPANNGTLAPTGALGVDTGPIAGFDIYSDLTNGKTTSVTGYAVLVPASGSPATLYTVNLLTGAATSTGNFPFPFGDIAVMLDTNP
jgi:hypothetical protein